MLLFFMLKPGFIYAQGCSKSIYFLKGLTIASLAPVKGIERVTLSFTGE